MNFAKNWKKVCVKLASATFTSAEFYMDMTIDEVREIIDDLNKEAKKRG